MGVFKRLIMTSYSWSCLFYRLSSDVFVWVTTSFPWVIDLAVPFWPMDTTTHRPTTTTLRTNAYPKTVSVIKMRDTYRAQERRITDKSYSCFLSYTPFNQKGILNGNERVVTRS